MRRPFQIGDGATKQDSEQKKLTEIRYEIRLRRPSRKRRAECRQKSKPDRIEASQAGNGPLGGIGECGHRPGGRLNAISADEEEQFTAVEVPGRNLLGPHPLLPGAELNAIDPLVRLALLVR